jgi:UDP-3-O-[3-hydroxymyristoyl] glucosamine N-acyltransferase
MIAHNVEVGENTIIISQAGIAGSTKIGKNCIIAGQAGIVGHLVIADNVKIGAQSGVEGNVPTPGVAILGSPAIEAGKAKRNYIHWRNLDDIVKRIYQLEKRIKNQKNE